MISVAFLAILILSVVVYVFARQRAIASANGVMKDLHSRPSYHGLFCALWILMIGLATLLVFGIASSAYVRDQVATVIADATDPFSSDPDIVAEAVALIGQEEVDRAREVGSLDAPEAAGPAQALSLRRDVLLENARAVAAGDGHVLRGSAPIAERRLLIQTIEERGLDAATAELRQRKSAEGLSGDLLNGAVAADLADAQAQMDNQLLVERTPVSVAAAATYTELAEQRDLYVAIAALAAALLTALATFMQVRVDFRARNRSERVIRSILFAAAALAILTTIGIVLSLVGETLQFMAYLDWQVQKFFFGLNWSPLSNQREGFIDENDVGWLPLLAGTMMITVIAMLVAVPVGLMSAVYLSDYASVRTRAWAKPMLEVLAGVPTVVYGFFAAITVAPFIRNAGESIGLTVSGQSALAAGIVMGIMIIPFISSLSDDVINAVPQSLRDGSYGLGATKAETIRRVILPAALPGIISAVILGVSRAVGETMIVVMAAGQGPNLTANPLESMTTVTVQIVMLITGDTEATLAAGPAFTLGAALFIVTLMLNIFALRIVRKYRERYD